MKKLTREQLPMLCAGAALLGSGGGGDTKILHDLLHFHWQDDIELLSLHDLTPQHLIVPIGFMGAPLVAMERIPNSTILTTPIKYLQKLFPDKKLVLLAMEIGGCNCLTPFVAAAQLKLPVLDADLIGRAFPQFDMTKAAVMLEKPGLSIMSNALNEIVTIDVATPARLEKIARTLTVEFGSVASLISYLIDAEKAEQYVIDGSVSKALMLGSAILQTQGNVENLAQKISATTLAEGVIEDLKQDLGGGFVLGFVKIKTKDSSLKIYFQNEYLYAEENKKSLAETPDIIAILDAETGLPIANEALSYGRKVQVISLPAPDFWQQDFAKKLVNLQAMNLEINHEL